MGSFEAGVHDQIYVSQIPLSLPSRGGLEGEMGGQGPRRRQGRDKAGGQGWTKQGRAMEARRGQTGATQES